jgi:AcrR family transcriptional regulator
LASSGAKAGVVRRAGYGASGPGVGALGGRTRQLVLDAGLDCFAAAGFHETVMEGIAAKAGVSRATVYQYFASKEAIFLELIEVGGADFLGLAKYVGPFGPDPAGFQNLLAWVTAWSGEVDKYSALFVEWSNVNARKAALRPRLAWFVERHTSVWVKQLADANLGIVSPETMAVLMLAMVDRYNYMRLVYRPEARATELATNLAFAFQQVLFPTSEIPTPTLRNEATSANRTLTDSSQLTSAGGVDAIAGLTLQGLSRVRTPQAVVTIRKLLDAAGRVFANNGYSGSNVDLIVSEAGLARGTFYKYFKERTQLLALLAQECAASLVPALVELEKLARDTDVSQRSVRLRILLAEFLRVQHVYSAVLRAWLEQQPYDPAVLAPYAGVRLQLRGTVAAMLSNAPADKRLDLEAAAMMFAALLERFPEESTGTRFTPTDAQIIEAEALFFERAFFVS